MPRPPTRPYFQHDIAQLQVIFDENERHSTILKQLSEELQHRTRPKAVVLRAKVDEALRILVDNKPQLKPVSMGRTPPITSPPTTHPINFASPRPPAPTPPNNSSPLASKSTGRGSSILTPSVQLPLFPDTKPREKPTTLPHAVPLRARREVPTRNVASDRGVIRARGNIEGVPEHYVFEPETTISLSLTQDTPLINRYEAALAGLIKDMRRNNTASRQLTLRDGKSVHFDANENCYQFPYEEDAELFEGATIVAVIGSIESKGQIISVSGRQLNISLNKDYGPHISHCVIKVDNTAMLEALRLRLEKIAGGEFPGFNTKLAESVMQNTGDQQPAAVLPQWISTNGLNPQQQRAISLALANEVLYIWGPPGTGKTQTLSALCQALFEGKKRILLCSNTNQAVDQVLLKLCRQFEGTVNGKQALDEGNIIRVGKIVHSELAKNWARYVTLDGIVERKSASLHERKALLEEHIDRIDKTLEHSMEILRQFQGFDDIVAKQKSTQEKYDNTLKIRLVALNQKRSHLEELKKLEDDLNRYKTAGSIKRTFMTKPDILQQRISNVREALEPMTVKIEKIEEESLEMGRQLKDFPSLLMKAGQSLLNFNRHATEKQVEDAEEKKRPLIEEICDITKKLDDIKKAVVEGARIVGATVTKAYLSPQLFTNFDVVIVDEASMVLLPAIYHAAGLAKEKVIVSGDFLQLAPIITTNQKAILDEIGTDVFHAAHVHSVTTEKKRRVMLEEQYRMDEHICKLISTLIYEGKLRTGVLLHKNPAPPMPFDDTLTIVDTTPICPFVNRDPFNSRYNLMNALAIRNLCLHFKENGYLVNDEGKSFVGVCTPYAAQAKVVKRIFKENGLETDIDSGTIHRYQGDEKAVMILDIPDSKGEARVGIFLQAISCDEGGAKLFNVAVSRAQSHLIVFANLGHLDKKLPGKSILRDILFNMQKGGKVLDVRDVLALYPVMDDLRKYGQPFNLSLEVEKTGLFNQADFDIVFRADMERARKGIAIFSGFITPQRVGTYEHLFRSKVASGVPVHCVTRPPDRNGTIPVDQGIEALDGLERMGCIVDTRSNIHQKVVIIDDEIVWFGSLNPLSHTSRTDEAMFRYEGSELATQVVAFIALDKGIKPENAGGAAYRQENPRCPTCGSRASYMIGRNGPYWRCESLTCNWTESYNRPRGTVRGDGNTPIQTGGMCPECGNALVRRSGRFRTFIGCSGYPTCNHKEH